jgi:hypothetical protein
MSFEGLVAEHAGEMKRLSTREALAIARYLEQARLGTAATLLQSISSDVDRVECCGSGHSTVR